MTAPPTYAEPTGPAATPTPAARPRRAVRWQSWALLGICLLAAVLYGWGIWADGWGNTFYTAGVKSMSENFTNFLFGSFDPAGVVTVDKPPMGLWPQVFSVWIFGLHGWSVLLPQVIEGVAAVFLLHRTVRHWVGEHVALLAALILTLTPITVAINHLNTPDPLLVLWLVASAYAFTRSVRDDATPRARTTWLLLCALFVGYGFVTKMLAAWIVVPGFALAFLFAARGNALRRIVDVAGAALVLLISSFWWPLLHDLWPGNKPYMGGSTNGTALNLIFAYNGFGRIFGEGFGRGGGSGFTLPADLPPDITNALRHGGGGGFGGGGIGLGRMFSDSVGGQISWLIPFSLLALAVVTVGGVLRLRAKAPGRPMHRAMWLMWGGWLVVMGLVFSYAQGIWHSYYTTAMAPPIAALSAAGAALMWRHYRQPHGLSWLCLPFAVTITACWAYVLVQRDPSWHGWAGPLVLLVGFFAVLGLIGAKAFEIGPLGRAGFVLGLVALLLVPTVWSAGTAFATGGSGGAMAQAGPPGGFGGFGGHGRGRAGGGGFPGGHGTAGNWNRRQGGFGRGSATLSAEQLAILDYVTKNAPNARIKLAIEAGAMQAAPFVIASNVTVIGMGGFMGSDNVPSIAQLESWVRTGQLRYVLGTSGQGGHGFGGFGRGGAAQARDQWVTQHCTVVDPSAYGGTNDQSDQEAGPFSAADTLYLCTD